MKSCFKNQIVEWKIAVNLTALQTVCIYSSWYATQVEQQGPDWLKSPETIFGQSRRSHARQNVPSLPVEHGAVLSWLRQIFQVEWMYYGIRHLRAAVPWYTMSKSSHLAVQCVFEERDSTAAGRYVETRGRSKNFRWQGDFADCTYCGPKMRQVRHGRQAKRPKPPAPPPNSRPPRNKPKKARSYILGPDAEYHGIGVILTVI